MEIDSNFGARIVFNNLQEHVENDSCFILFIKRGKSNQHTY